MTRRGVILSGVSILLLSYAAMFPLWYLLVEISATYWPKTTAAQTQLVHIDSDQPWQPGPDPDEQVRTVHIRQPRAEFDVRQFKSDDGVIRMRTAHNIRPRVGRLLIESLLAAIALTAVVWPLFVLIVNAVTRWWSGRRRQTRHGFDVLPPPERLT